MVHFQIQHDWQCHKHLFKIRLYLSHNVTFCKNDHLFPVYIFVYHQTNHTFLISYNLFPIYYSSPYDTYEWRVCLRCNQCLDGSCPGWVVHQKIISQAEKRSFIVRRLVLSSTFRFNLLRIVTYCSFSPTPWVCISYIYRCLFEVHFSKVNLKFPSEADYVDRFTTVELKCNRFTTEDITIPSRPSYCL